MSENQDLSWKKKLQEHDDRLTAIAESARVRCFEQSEFERRVSEGDPWQKLIQCHLYLEYIATNLLSAELVHPKAIRFDRMGFSARLDLIAAMGLVPLNFIAAVKKVSQLRNGVAHKLNYEVTERGN